MPVVSFPDPKTLLQKHAKNITAIDVHVEANARSLHEEQKNAGESNIFDRHTVNTIES